MAVNQLKAGALLNYVVLGLNALVGIAYTPYMLRMMGQSEFGIYSLAATVIAYLSILDLGFGNAVIRYTAKFRAEGKAEEQYSMFGMFTVLYSVIGIVAFIAGLILYFNVDTMFGATLTPIELERTRVIILFMVFNLAVTFPLSIYGAIITAYEDFIFLRVVQIARIILSTVVMICLLTMGYRAIAMVVVQTVFNLLTLGINYFYCKNKIKIKVKYSAFKWDFVKEVAIYSFWIFLNAIMDRIYWSTGQFVLGALVGTAAVAVFAVAIQLQHLYMMFSTAISGVFLPRVTAMVSKNDNKTEISNLFIRTGRIQYLILALVLSGFIAFGKDFIFYWAGSDYADAYYITLLFFVPLTIPLIQNLGITILQARNQMKFRSIAYIIIAVGSLLLQIPLAKFYGSIGCAWGIAIALILGQFIVMNIYYHKKQGLNIIKFWKEILKMSIIPIFMCVIAISVMEALNTYSISQYILLIVGYVILYAFLSVKFMMNDSERALFLSPLKKVFKR